MAVVKIPMSGFKARDLSVPDAMGLVDDASIPAGLKIAFTLQFHPLDDTSSALTKIKNKRSTGSIDCRVRR